MLQCFIREPGTKRPGSDQGRLRSRDPGSYLSPIHHHMSRRLLTVPLLYYQINARSKLVVIALGEKKSREQFPHWEFFD